MTRNELRIFAADRVEDANQLLNNQRWHAAYYLVGYALECGLKSCILAHVEATGIIFKDKKFAERCWTHNLVDLIKQAGLQTEFEQQLQANANFAGFWGVAKDWNAESRYENKSQVEAEGLYEAITNNPDGILEWLQARW